VNENPVGGFQEVQNGGPPSGLRHKGAVRILGGQMPDLFGRGQKNEEMLAGIEMPLDQFHKMTDINGI
jgi:hypothetical protein